MALSPSNLRRVLACAALAAAFTIMASVFSPQRSTADGENQPARRAGNQFGGASAEAHAGLRSLGSLETGRYTVQMFATDHGARYTIIEPATSLELGTLLTAAQVHQQWPDLALPEIDFSATEPLMLTEPESIGWR